MKLSAIEAIRYGSLENLTIDGFSDGLTVVLGPNESGKSSLTALTRHVLYGFPTRSMKDRGYHLDSGSRAGRLVFSDTGGEWAIERVDGPKGGPCQVVARSGMDRHDLLTQLTSGVTEQTFRVVFGFGIDELKQIESADASELVARLYAAGSGLGVNPMDVRRQLQSRVDELYTVRGKNQVINRLVSAIRQTRDRIREIESQIAGHAQQQAVLTELQERLGPLRERRLQLEEHASTLERALQRARSAAERVAEAQATQRKLRIELAEIRARRDLVTVDDAVLAAGPALSAVLEEMSGFKERFAASEKSVMQAEGIEAELATGTRFPEGVDDSPEAKAAVERWRDRLATLQSAQTSTEDAARRAEVRAEQLANADVATVAPTSGADRLPGIVAVTVGAIGLVLGLVMGQWVAAVLGAVVAAAGVALLMRRPQSQRASLSDDLVRARVDVDAAKAVAADAQTRYASAFAEWQAWLSEHRLDAAGDDPVAVRQLLDVLTERRRRAHDAARCRADAARDADAAQRWIDQLVDAMRRYDPGVGVPAPTAAQGLAAQARERLEAARRADVEATRLDEDLSRLHAALSEIEGDAARHTTVLTEVAESCGCDPVDPLPELQSMHDTALAELRITRDEYEALSSEASKLEGQLNADGMNDSLTRARQEMEGLRAQAAAAGERYVTHALAVHLLDRTRERYEAQRQPEVIRNAGEIFRAMTDGRYRGVRATLETTGAAEAITVIGSDGGSRTTDKLSRGTAEQLYLALRVGLITSLGDVGASLPVLMDDVLVNFDPDRRRGAAIAVAQLAKVRQVLFFTCHPETAAVLEGTVSGTKVIELGRCELR